MQSKRSKIANYYDELFQSFENAFNELKIDCSDVYDFSEWHENIKKDIRTCLEKIDGNLTKSSHSQPDSGTIFTVTKNFTDDLSDSLILKSFENLFVKCKKGNTKYFKPFLRRCLGILAYLCLQIKCSFEHFGQLARAGFKDVGSLMSKITTNLNEASDSLKDEDVTKFVEFRRFDLSGVVENLNADLIEFRKDEVEIKLDD